MSRTRVAAHVAAILLACMRDVFTRRDMCSKFSRKAPVDMVGDRLHVNGEGLPDIVVGNKKGTFVHLHQRTW